MIEKYDFGHMVIRGEHYTDDIKIIRGRVVAKWRRMRGHTVNTDDVNDILGARPDILVIGRGSPGQMRTTGSFRIFLKNRKIELIEEKTADAVKTFNRLFQEGKNVAAGFHLSC